jgi:hypothetical protein
MPAFVRTESNINFANTGGAWPNLKFKDYYVARFTGQIIIRTEGQYTFWTESDDGSKCYINGRLVVNNPGRHGWRSKSGKVSLQVGNHNIRIEFFEWLGHAGLRLLYEGPGVKKQVVPPGVLQHEDGRASSVSSLKYKITSGNIGNVFKLARSNDESYRGTISRTSTGFICQKWSVQIPHRHSYYTEAYIKSSGIGDHNYCRNPGGAKERPWCFTTSTLQWEHCDTPTGAQIVVAKNGIDREDPLIGGIYILTITATDEGSPPLTDTATVQVLVDDENEAPRILKGSNVATQTGQWVVLNNEDVCFSSHGNQFGEFLVAHDGSYEEIKISHVKGSVSCNGRQFSKWGCGLNEALSVYVTNVKDNIVVPDLSDSKFKVCSNNCNKKMGQCWSKRKKLVEIRRIHKKYS